MNRSDVFTTLVFLSWSGQGHVQTVWSVMAWNHTSISKPTYFLVVLRKQPTLTSSCCIAPQRAERCTHMSWKLRICVIDFGGQVCCSIHHPADRSGRSYRAGGVLGSPLRLGDWTNSSTIRPSPVVLLKAIFFIFLSMRDCLTALMTETILSQKTQPM